MTLKGASVLVTGAGSGIGAATVSRLAASGARVGAMDRVEMPSAEGVLARMVDVTDEPAVNQAVDTVVGAHGGLDVVVCVAGIDHVGPLEDTSIDVWQRLYDVNVLGQVRVLRAALPALRRSERACAVLVGSAVATVGLAQRAAYTATKGAIVAMTRSLAAELAPTIRVVCVSPGSVDTPLLDVVAEHRNVSPVESRALAARNQPLGRLGTADEIANTIAFVVDPDSGLHTGSNILIDGGMTAVYRQGGSP